MNEKLAKKVVAALKTRGLLITTVESCTGGGLADSITNIEGASDVFDRAWITYSTDAKLALGVPADVVETYSVYSQETAVAMAQAGATTAVADVAVGITGQLSFPGPMFGNRVFIAVVFGEKTQCAEVTFPTEYTRPKAKADVVEKALQLVLIVLSELKPLRSLR